MAKIFDKVINYNVPQLEDVVIKTHSLKTGVFSLNVGKYKIELSKEEKEDLIAEWDLMERLNIEWKAKNINNQEEYFKFLEVNHNV